MEMLAALLLWTIQETPVERYLSEKDKAARARILAEIKAPPSEVEAELRRPPRRADPAQKGQIVRKRLAAEHPLAVEFEYVLWVPADCDPAKRYRLIVSLHGQNGTGDGFLRNWLADVQRAGDTFLLCPTAGRGGWGRSLLGHAYILTSLRDVLATYPVDPDLVFLDGASMGGNGSFEFACQYPDLFAGAAPRAGGPMFRYLPAAPGTKERQVTTEGIENLVATPVYWVIGAKDHEVPYAWVKVAKAQLDALKFDFTCKEFPDGGHEWFPQENAAVFEWMKSKRRDPYPARVGIWTQDRTFSRRFWLEVSEFKGKELLKRGYMDASNKTIEDRTLFTDPITVRAELLREKNEIKISATGTRELRVYLHEKMLDLAKPVVLTVNGSRSTFDAKPSLETLLESARRDRGLLYSASIKARVP
jgi:pimeloyl-ACP methyl ester carboxylesterase